MSVVKSLVSHLLNVGVILFFSTVLFSQESPVSGMQPGHLNFNFFTNPIQGVLSDWKDLNSEEQYMHPEFGKLPYNAPCQNCVEVLSRRTASSRFFIDIDDRSKFYQQNAHGDLHVLRDGFWISIDPQLKPQSNGTFAAINQLDPVVFNPAAKYTSIFTPQATIHFNQWKLIGKKNGVETILFEANWDNFTVGNDGMYVHNIFPGIDAQFVTARGAVKTNFMVKQLPVSDLDELIFRDNFSGDFTGTLTFQEFEGTFGVGNLSLSSNGIEIAEIEQAVLYPRGGEKEHLLDIPYRIAQNRMDIVIPGQIITSLIEEFGEVIIDPLVTSSNTLAQASITGSGYNITCFNGFCTFNLTVPTPANSTVTNVLWSFNYRAQNGCWRNEGAVSYFLGTCRSPAANNFFWFCNLASAGDCTGNNISIFNDVASCLPAPSCTPQNLNFTMRFHRCYSSGAGCSNTCIGAISPWTMTVEGRTLEYVAASNQITVSNTTICAGQSITASTSTQFGVPAYSYNWSFSPSGTPSVGTGPSTSITFPNPGTITLYSLVTDACGNQVTVNRNITVTSAPVVTANPNPITICSGQSTGIGLTSSMNNTSYSWTVVQSGVTGASNGTANGGGGPTSPYTLNQTLTNIGSSPGTATYTITPTSGGCPGQPITVIVTVNPVNSVSPSSSNPTVCVNTAINPVITHTTTGATGIGAATGLPAGVTASWSGNSITISGTPTAPGTFTYTIPLTGGCGTVNATGTITVISVNTVSAASSNPTVCMNTAISPVITHTTTGATGIGTATGLPAGVTANWSSNTITISGTPTTSGTFTYTIPLTGGCGTVNATGTITVVPNNSVSASSSNPTICVNTAISPVITHTTTGATGIGTATGLPAGVTASWSGNTITISGTPTSTGFFSYTIPLTGGCGTLNATGTITVISENTVSSASSNPTLCVNTAISPTITHSTTGATGIGTATGLPAGVTASWAANTITISGTPTAPGTFNYTIPLTGGCGTVNATGTITVNPTNTVNAASSSPTVCVNIAINPVITHVTTGATGIGTASGLPAGVSASWSGNTITISGTPTVTGTFTYTIPLTGGCGTVNATGTLSVNDAVTPSFAQLEPYCSGASIPALPVSSQNGITGTWSPTIDNTATTTYTFTPASGQCANTTTMTVTINPSNTPTFTSVGPYCSGATIPALPNTSQNGINGSWSPAINNTATTTYTFTPESGQCATATTISVAITTVPAPTISGSGSYCIGDNINILTATGIAGSTLVWYSDANLTTQIGTGSTIQPGSNQGVTTYYITATIDGCISSPSFAQVTINPLPNISAGSDITACQGQPITLTGSGGISYTWDNGVTNGVPFTQQESSVTYTVTGIDANGCSNQDQVVVNLQANPEPTFVPSVTSGCSPLQVSFINTSGNSSSSSCTWDFGNGGTATSCGTVNTVYSTPGCYNVALTINYSPGCTSTTNLINLICVDNNPIAQFEPTPATADINVPINFTNLSSGATNYSWNFGDNLGASSEPNPAYAYTDIGNFLVTLIAENDNGCKDSISKIIVINEQLIFYVPNAFTPDGNKHNETFQPIFTSGFDIYGYNLLIFNRWGEVVFESNNAAVGWNGTYGGEIAPEGVYVWQIKVKVIGVDKPEIHRGHVNLLR